ncbi:MAG: hypothetical protein KJZ86_23215 [Caldilineaceae bacterium]|nr:hypothetical protein [Caldilineaceae bacterium]
MKHTTLVVAALLLLAALALAPDGPALFAAQSAQHAHATPTPAAQPEPAVTAAATAPRAIDPEPSLADLMARIESLEATVAELYAVHESAHAATYDEVNAVNVAIYLLDSAGLHELETRLVNESKILAGDGGQVGRTGRLLATVAWPAELAGEAISLQEKLAALAAALADDDLATVKPLSTDTHVAYHLFSHNAQMWLAQAVEGAMADGPGQTNRVNTALYLLDGVDLHGLHARLSEKKEILPGDSGPVLQVARLLSTVDWPQDLADKAATLHETLSALADALADDDLKTATPLAEKAHDAQHEFSHLGQDWLAEGAMDGHHDGVEPHDEKPTEHSHGG